jgi:hypothetical protein
MQAARDYNPAVKDGAKWLLSDIAGGGYTVFVSPLFVSSSTGSDAGSGEQNSPFKTITAAAAKAVANGALVVGPGSYSEAVTIPTAITGLAIIAGGNSVNDTKWTSATDTSTLTINAKGCSVSGFRFSAPTYTASAAVSAITFGGADYANISGNRFQGQTGSYNAIYSPVCNSDNVTIAGNDFEYFNTATYGAAILGVEAGGLSYSNWQLIGNKFGSCVTNVNINGRVCLVQGNTFNVAGINAAGAGATVTTLSIDLSGTSSYGNAVHGNYLAGAYTATLYKVGAAGDDWSGNFAIGGGTGVANGITTANPV